MLQSAPDVTATVRQLAAKWHEQSALDPTAAKETALQLEKQLALAHAGSPLPKPVPRSTWNSEPGTCARGHLSHQDRDDGDLVLRRAVDLAAVDRLPAGLLGLLELMLARSFFRSATSVRLASLASRRSALRPAPMSL